MGQNKIYCTSLKCTHIFILFFRKFVQILVKKENEIELNKINEHFSVPLGPQIPSGP